MELQWHKGGDHGKRVADEEDAKVATDELAIDVQRSGLPALGEK
jgi:hypothetical protein